MSAHAKPLTADEEMAVRYLFSMGEDMSSNIFNRLLATLDAARAARMSIDADRLAEAMNKVRPYGGNPSAWALVAAKDIVREYDALAEAEA